MLGQLPASLPRFGRSTIRSRSKRIASSHLGNIPLLMATEADDRHLAAGKLAKAISRPLASCIRATPGGVGPEGEHGQHPEPTTATTVTPVADARSPRPGTPCPDQAAEESAEKTSRTMAANPNR